VPLARIENGKLKVENEGISFGNDFKLCAKRTPSFSILHFPFSICAASAAP
jgi:hypothetical protein